MLMDRIDQRKNMQLQEYIDRVLEEVEIGLENKGRNISQSGIKSIQENILLAEKNGESVNLRQLEKNKDIEGLTRLYHRLYHQLELDFMMYTPAMVEPIVGKLLSGGAVGMVALAVGMIKDKKEQKRQKHKTISYHIKLTEYQRKICDMLDRTDIDNRERYEYLHSLEILVTGILQLMEK